MGLTQKMFIILNISIPGSDTNQLFQELFFFLTIPRLRLILNEKNPYFLFIKHNFAALTVLRDLAVTL